MVSSSLLFTLLFFFSFFLSFYLLISVGGGWWVCSRIVFSWSQSITCCIQLLLTSCIKFFLPMDLWRRSSLSRSLLVSFSAFFSPSSILFTRDLLCTLLLVSLMWNIVYINPLWSSFNFEPCFIGFQALIQYQAQPCAASARTSLQVHSHNILPKIHFK